MPRVSIGNESLPIPIPVSLMPRYRYSQYLVILKEHIYKCRAVKCGPSPGQPALVNQPPPLSDVQATKRQWPEKEECSGEDETLRMLA